MWGHVHSAWGRAVAAITVAVVATTPALSSAASTRQMAAAAGGATELSLEQTGPRDLVVTNSGATAVTFPGPQMRRLARTLKLDPRSTCFGVSKLAPGDTCDLRLRGAVGGGAASVGFRVAKDVDGTVTLTNTGEAALPLAGATLTRLLQRAGVRDGDCATGRTLPSGMSCTLRPGSAAPPAARTASSADRLMSFQQGTIPGQATGMVWASAAETFSQVLAGIWSWLGILGLWCALEPGSCTAFFRALLQPLL